MARKPRPDTYHTDQFPLAVSRGKDPAIFVSVRFLLTTPARSLINRILERAAGRERSADDPSGLKKVGAWRSW